jgi:CDP-glycerol glycerophosphotransferase
VPLRTVLAPRPEANLVGGHRYQDYAPGAATVMIDLSALPTPEQRTTWRLRFDLGTRGLRRTGGFTSREERTAAGLLGRAVHAPRLVGDVMGGLRAEGRTDAVVVVEPAPSVRALAVRAEGRTVRGRLTGATEGRLEGHGVSTRLVPDGQGGSTFELRLPAGREEVPRRWPLVVDGPGGGQQVACPQGWTERYEPGFAGGPVIATRGEDGFLEVVETTGTLLVTDVELERRRLRVRGHWLGAGPGGWRLSLSNARATIEVSGRSDDRSFEAVVPLEWDEWGLGSTPVPLGAYPVTVELTDRPGGEVLLLLHESLLGRLVTATIDADFRMFAARGGRGLLVRLDAPLGPDERGPYHQRRLQRWSAGDDLGIDEGAVYLQSYSGLSATDSQRALHDELRRTRPELTLYWAVASSATRVPEGGVPVLMYSREWYRVIGSARYLCNNIDFDRWFRRKPEQGFLQTFHGYPAKSMGIRLWEAKQFTPRRIELELGRTSRDWTLILTPCPEMDRYYRIEYAYDGAIESTGYPRDDALLAPDAAEVRERTRRLLGIGSDQTAVLYAPTWRDDQATTYRSATLTRHLDLESATARLGAEYVFLMRGHRFHAQAQQERSARSARLVDVTDYPEINDLLLASDAAVLDYSSLRFDFALTGRPMLFLVPDLRSYTGGVRGFLYPFEESAPGPLLQTADEVIEALQRLDAVHEEYAGAYAEFQRRYNYLQDGRSAERVVSRFFR